MMKDPQFQSSFKFVISLLTFPIFYIIQSLVILLILDDWGITLIYLVSLPLTAPIAYWWREFFNKIKIGWNYKTLSMKKNKELIKMQKLYNGIIKRADSIFQKK